MSLSYDLTCYKCLNIFESMPITLVPCGWIVCSHHLNADTIKCFICTNEHEIIRNDCVSTKTIESKYKKYLIKNQLKNIESLNNPNGDSYEEILHKTESQREIAKLLLENHFEDILNQAKCLEKDEIFELTSISEDINFEINFGHIKPVQKKLSQIEEPKALGLKENIPENLNTNENIVNLTNFSHDSSSAENAISQKSDNLKSQRPNEDLNLKTVDKQNFLEKNSKKGKILLQTIQTLKVNVHLQVRGLEIENENLSEKESHRVQVILQFQQNLAQVNGQVH